MSQFKKYLEIIQESENNDEDDLKSKYGIKNIPTIKSLNELEKEDNWEQFMRGAKRIVFKTTANKIYFLSGDYAPEEINKFCEIANGKEINVKQDFDNSFTIDDVKDKIKF